VECSKFPQQARTEPSQATKQIVEHTEQKRAFPMITIITIKLCEKSLILARDECGAWEKVTESQSVIQCAVTVTAQITHL